MRLRISTLMLGTMLLLSMASTAHAATFGACRHL